MEELHHECGVFGIYGVDNAAQYAYYALHSLQHRGQQGCGIVSVDKQGMHLHKGAGLVIEIFGEKHLCLQLNYDNHYHQFLMKTL